MTVFFEIQSSQPEREVKFYSHIFGWTFIKDDTAPIELYRIDSTEILGCILKRPVEVPPKQYGTNAFVCSFEVENFENTLEVITQNGGQVIMPKFKIPNRCWQGYFLDQDNNAFGIFEMIKN